MTQIPPGTLDSLPKQFVTAMRTLFDIMDDKRTGYVNLTDIENRWRDDRTKGLPRGVIESLQNVACHEGLLTFERFCTGLKISLLRSQVDHEPPKTRQHSKAENHFVREQLKVQIHRPPSAPLLDLDDAPTRNSNWNANVQSVDKVAQHRAVSMPQLAQRQENPAHPPPVRYEAEDMPPSSQAKCVLYGPPKPPRVEKLPSDKSDPRHRYRSDDGAGFEIEGTEDKKCPFGGEPLLVLARSRGLGDGKPAAEPAPPRKPSKRREPRRHTLQNGVDYNLLKRMKQIEQEKDILMQGLAAIEKARDWYLKQLAEVQEKMRYAGRMGAHVEQWTEAQQERLELQRVRVLELNRQLAALAEGWRRGGLSLHMNLALAAPAPHAVLAHNDARLKRQNHMLTEEVTKKSERISVLEREKSALIRELLLTTNRNKTVDNVF